MTRKEFNKAVDQWADPLYRYAIKQAGEEALASDAVQEAFEVLWQKRQSLRFEKAKGYLFSTVHNRLIDYQRQLKRQEELGNVSPDQVYYCQEYKGAKEMIDHLLDQLPADQKSVLLLRDYEGHSYKEIAEITQLNEAQVKVYIHRARKYLRNYIVKKENLL